MTLDFLLIYNYYIYCHHHRYIESDIFYFGPVTVHRGSTENTSEGSNNYCLLLMWGASSRKPRLLNHHSKAKRRLKQNIALAKIRNNGKHEDCSIVRVSSFTHHHP